MKNQSFRRAYWIQKTYLFRADEYICSACNYSADEAYLQCPCCDAEMSRSKYDPSWVDEMEMLDSIFDD